MSLSLLLMATLGQATLYAQDAVFFQKVAEAQKSPDARIAWLTSLAAEPKPASTLTAETLKAADKAFVKVMRHGPLKLSTRGHWEAQLTRDGKSKVAVKTWEMPEGRVTWRTNGPQAAIQLRPNEWPTLESSEMASDNLLAGLKGLIRFPMEDDQHFRFQLSEKGPPLFYGHAMNGTIIESQSAIGTSYSVQDHDWNTHFYVAIDGPNILAVFDISEPKDRNGQRAGGS